jgi:hypothetical protein
MVYATPMARGDVRYITENPRGINPVDTYGYIDKIQVWCKQPLLKDELSRLQSLCGGALHVHDQPAWFDSRYRQRLQLNQPKDAALALLARRDNLLLNYAEISLDWVFDDQIDTVDAFRMLDRYHVKKHHRDQGVRFVAGLTRYSGPRKAPNVLAVYRDRHCKVTGEAHCVHLDWRIRGAEALRHAGLGTIQQLRKLDYRSFWRKRLVLYRLNSAKLGRRYHNYFRGSTRQRAWVIPHYHVDARTGQTMLWVLGSVQRVLDTYAGRLNVRSCLQPINVDHLLPSTHTAHSYDYVHTVTSTSPTSRHTTKFLQLSTFRTGISGTTSILSHSSPFKPLKTGDSRCPTTTIR